MGTLSLISFYLSTHRVTLLNFIHCEKIWTPIYRRAKWLIKLTQETCAPCAKLAVTARKDLEPCQAPTPRRLSLHTPLASGCQPHARQGQGQGEDHQGRQESELWPSRTRSGRRAACQARHQEGRLVLRQVGRPDEAQPKGRQKP